MSSDSRLAANRLVLGRVHIVEWLNPGDDGTGRKLFDELLQIGAAAEPKVEVEFHRVDTAGQLLGLLLVFTEQYRAEKRTPILHPVALTPCDRTPSRLSALPIRKASGSDRSARERGRARSSGAASTSLEAPAGRQDHDDIQAREF
jgi:hypothetical protein